MAGIYTLAVEASLAQSIPLAAVFGALPGSNSPLLALGGLGATIGLLPGEAAALVVQRASLATASDERKLPAAFTNFQ